MDVTTTFVVVHRARRRRPVRRYLVMRGRMGQNAAIGQAYDQAQQHLDELLPWRQV